MHRMILPLLLLVSASAAASQPAPAEERWISDWGHGVCKLIRARGDQPRMMIEVTPGMGSYNLWLIDSDMKLQRGQRYENVQIRVGGEVSDVYRLERWRKDGSNYDILFGIPQDSLAAIEQADSFSLEHEGQILTTRPLSGTRNAIPVLRDCINDQLRTWGIDPAAHAALSRGVGTKSSIANWVSSNNYPWAALREPGGGRTIVRLTVDEQGRLAECKVVLSSGQSALDRRTCAVMQRGEFEPALGASGNPTRASRIIAISWRIAG